MGESKGKGSVLSSTGTERQTYLADHEDLVWLGKLGKLFQRRHEALVVVSPAGGVDENHVVALLRGVGDGILGNGDGILAVALLIQLHLTALASRQLLEVAHMNRELLNGTGAERVASGDEYLVLILQQEEADLGQVRRLAYAIDTDYRDNVGPGLAERRGKGRRDGVDFAQEIEGRGWRQHLGERRLHGRLDLGVDACRKCQPILAASQGRCYPEPLTFKAPCLDAGQLLLDPLTQPHGGLARNVLPQQVVLHALHRLVQILLGQCLAPDDVSEESADSINTGP